jgi:hypothetical protein
MKRRVDDVISYALAAILTVMFSCHVLAALGAVKTI